LFDKKKNEDRFVFSLRLIKYSSGIRLPVNSVPDVVCFSPQSGIDRVLVIVIRPRSLSEKGIIEVLEKQRTPRDRRLPAGIEF